MTFSELLAVIPKPSRRALMDWLVTLPKPDYDREVMVATANLRRIIRHVS